jgi:predicted nucleic acid-binding protein
MQHVVDASVVAKWFLPETHKEKAERLLRDFLDDKVQLTAPDLVVAEVGNLLWKRSIKLKDISQSQADQMYGAFLAIGLPLCPSVSIAASAFKLSIEREHPIYDMLYIALAEENGCKFVTADEKLFNKFGNTFNCLCWIGDI